MSILLNYLLSYTDTLTSTASGGEEKEKKPSGDRDVLRLGGVTNDIAIEALCKEVSNDNAIEALCKEVRNDIAIEALCK